MLAKILDLKGLRETFLTLNYTLLKSLRISRERYNQRIIPPWTAVKTKFYNLISVFQPYKHLKDKFEKSSRWIKLCDPYVEIHCGNTTTFPDDFPSVSFSIYNSLLLHIAKKSTRKAIRWLRVVDDKKKSVVWDMCIIVKLMRDAFRLKNGRSIELSVINVVSQIGGWWSRNLSDIVQASMMEEDSLNVLKNNQVCDGEVTLLRLCGVPDPMTGCLIGTHFVNVGDSVWLEKAIGMDSSRTEHPYLWNGMTSKTFRGQRNETHVCHILIYNNEHSKTYILDSKL